ncbi:hypothetical protein LEMLEM_LOCUS11733 [Lemmus lemmus]
MLICRVGGHEVCTERKPHFTDLLRSKSPDSEMERAKEVPMAIRCDALSSPGRSRVVSLCQQYILNSVLPANTLFLALEPGVFGSHKRQILERNEAIIIHTCPGWEKARQTSHHYVLVSM